MPHDATTDPTEERRWVAALRVGDRAAMEAIYARYFTPLWKFAAGRVGSAAAEDVVQDVFLAVWRRREELAEDTSLPPYLFAAVRRRAIDLVRHGRVADAAVVGWEPSGVPGHGAAPASPADDAALSELTGAMAAVINTLSERSRTLMRLRWVHGMTYEQIAAVMGISVDAAKKQGRRMQQALAPLLARFRDG